MSKRIQCAGCLNDLGMYYLQCSLCSKSYDLDCCRMDLNEYKKLSHAYKTSWSCVICCSSRRKGGDNTNTPVRIARAGDSQDAEPHSERQDSNITIRNKGNARSNETEEDTKQCRLIDAISERVLESIRQELP